MFASLGGGGGGGGLSDFVENLLTRVYVIIPGSILPDNRTTSSAYSETRAVI